MIKFLYFFFCSRSKCRKLSTVNILPIASNVHIVYRLPQGPPLLLGTKTPLLLDAETVMWSWEETCIKN